MTEKVYIIIGLCLLTFSAGAQSVIMTPREKDGRSSGRLRTEHYGPFEMPSETKLSPMDPKRGFDPETKKLEEKMAERSWGSEDTAWSRACELDSKESYQKYVAIYPNGAHRPQASQRLIDLQVNDIFDGDHGNLPKMNWVSEDEDSPTSTITVENGTRYPLTVMYSGEDSRSIVISPGLKGTVSLPNGQYRIAASVPAGNVRPFAGRETFKGGSYEVCYVIVPASGFSPSFPPFYY